MLEYLDEDKCFQRKDYRSLCNATVQCKDTLTCFDEKCQCDKSNYWKGNVCIQNRPSECEDLNYTVDGVYPVYPGGNTKRTYVYCIKRDNTKWTVIQRRNDGTVNFYRALSEYTQGFGRADKEHWLGNMKIHRITQDETHELSIHLEDWNGNQRQANYSQFSVGSGNLYNLRVSGYSGNAGDSLTYHNGQSFYTKNRDNNSCAKKYRGAWWYRSCYHSNLNGKYNGTGNTGVVWNDFGGVSLKSSIMIIRRR
ncbi:fibrinogen C domain-containing protein 1-like isoform X3 [Mytilus trossulus]|uniref:fibrinogen C domain-containing protein 1-like isoform X3 n=1 Tax=Mytilus trossulus TaxID=6551 RepID=UPI003004D69C